MNYALMHYYTDPNEKVRLSLFSQILGFSALLVYITLIPFDVYSTVNHYSSILFGLQIYDFYFCKKLTHSLLTSSCVVDFWLVILLCFVVLPFTYYYAEEVLVSEDGGDFLFGRDESSGEEDDR